MRPLFSFFIHNYKLTFLIMLIMVIIGVMGAINLKRETRPPVDFATVLITSSYPGASPEEVENQITTKIEEEISGTEGLKDVNSVSQTGQSVITIRLDQDHYKTDDVADDIQRALQKVQNLPPELTDRPNFFQFNAKEIPIIELALIGDNKDRLRDHLADELESFLEDDPNIADVSLSGYREREYQVLLDPIKLQHHYVGIKEVVDAVKKRSQNIPAGFIKSPGNQKLVRITGQVKSAKEMGDIVVRSNFTGQKVTINDVAEVKDGAADPSILVRVNGQPATLVTITKKAQADTIRTVERINEKIKSFQNKMPKGYSIVEYNNEATRIENRLDIVINNALLGLVLVFIIMMIFLPGSLGAIASLSLPVAIFGTLGMMYIYDINFNNITMLAMVISIGMLVDNSVVISENYARLRQMGIDRDEAALQAAQQFWIPLTATVLTTIVAFLPMLVTKGVMGQFIRWIPIMVSIALSISLFEGFLLLPARLRFTVKDIDDKNLQGNKNDSHWFKYLKTNFESFMAQCIHHRYIVLSVVSVVLVLSVLLNIFGNRFELFPSEEVENYFVGFEVPITTTLFRTDELAGELSQQVFETLGKENIKYIIAQSGTMKLQQSNSKKNGDYVGMLNIAIPFEVAKTLNPINVLKDLRHIENKNFSKLSFQAARGGPPVGQPLNLTFRSKNYQQLSSIVKEFKDKLSKIKGVEDLEDDEVKGGPEFKLTPNYTSIARLKLDTETIGVAMRTALQGAFTSELSLDGDDFKIKVRYNDDYRETIDALKQTKIMEPSGKLIPLLSIVNLENIDGPSVRKHYNFKRSISLTSDVNVEQITSIQLNKIARELFDEISPKYPSVTATFGGEEESTKESTSSLKNAMYIALLSIFSILVFLFHSYSIPALILSSIPLGLIGVSWAFFFHGKPLSFLALIGIVGLAGVVVNSAIVLVSYVHELTEKQKVPLLEALTQASGDRLRAVLVTSLTTVGGLFPTAYSFGGHDPILVPMTLALAWGLVSGTLLTLIWIPCGYAIINDINQWVSSVRKNIILKVVTALKENRLTGKTKKLRGSQ